VNRDRREILGQDQRDGDSGRLTITPSLVHMSGNIPFLALLFMDQIEEMIRALAEQLLA
jgi:hypothetical protein